MRDGMRRIGMCALVAALLLSAVTACSRSSSETLDAVSEQTANVATINITAEELASAARLPVEQVVEIGGNASDSTNFSRISSLEYTDSGEVFVVDGLAYNVRVYDNAGKFVRQLSGRGAGPGEVMQPRHIVLSHDTIYLADSQKIHRFLIDGTFIGRVSHLIGGSDKKWGSYSMLPDGLDMTDQGIVSHFQFNAMMSSMNGSPPHVSSDTTSLFHVDVITGKSSAPFQRVVSNEVYPAGESSRSLPFFAPVVHFAVMRDGRVVTNARDGTALVVSKAGTPITRIQLAGARREVTDADVKSVIERRRARWDAMKNEPNLEVPKNFTAKHVAAIRKLPHYRYHPLVGQLIVSTNGKIVVERPDLGKGTTGWDGGGGPTVWDVLSTDYKLLGRIELPNGFEPMIMRGDVILGRTKDEDDVPSVGGYRIGGR